MPEETRVLRLSEMLSRQKGRPARRLIHAILSVALRLFFRRIETSGQEERIPMTGALIFVLNHPNGLIDPALVFCALPRPISFLAKSTLFRIPFVGWVMRVVEALPVYRRVDEGEALTRNRRTFEACRELLRRGRSIALFPEGVSHDAPHLLPVKTGAARIALGAASVQARAGVNSGAGEPDDALDLKIVPVGLYYTSKTSFRSEALLRFGEALSVTPVELDADGEPPRDEVKTLSERIEAGLKGVTLNVADDEEMEVATKAGQLFSSIYEGINVEQSLATRFDFLRRFAAWGVARTGSASERVSRLRVRLVAYESELRRVGLAPENLSLSSHPAWFVFRHFIFRGALLLALSPLALTGGLLHLPAFVASTVIARLLPKHGADDAGATVKILAAIVLVPLTWLVLTAAAYFPWGWRVSVVALPFAVVCGYVAMRSLEELYDMRGWFRAALLLLRKRRLFLRLLLERRTLHNEIKELGDAAADERTAMFE